MTILSAILTYFVIVFVIFFTLVVIALFCMKANYRCSHCKYCEWYSPKSFVCNETAGWYYPDAPAGCCCEWNRKIEAREKELKKAKEKKAWK